MKRPIQSLPGGYFAATENPASPAAAVRVECGKKFTSLPTSMEPTPNPDRPTPAEVRYDPVAGAGGFLATLTGRAGLWFTPRHIVAMIHPEQDFQLANPPFASLAASH